MNARSLYLASISLALSTTCGRTDWSLTDHCATYDGDAYCLREYPTTRPFCARPIPECDLEDPQFRGCLPARPDDDCYSPCGGSTEDAAPSILEDASCIDASTGTTTTSTTTGTTMVDMTAATTLSESGTSEGDTSGLESSDSTSSIPGCLEDSDCGTPELPACDLDTGECVPCGSAQDPDAACLGFDPLLPICFENTCVACSEDDPGACTDDTPVCFDSACVPCSDDDPGSCTEDTPVCLDHACVPCSADNLGACQGTTPLCDPTALTCIGCTAHDQCPPEDPGSGAACNLITGACLPLNAVSYVHSDAPCPGLGTPDEPFCRISNALAGDGDATVYVHEGSSYREDLVIEGERTVVIFAAENEVPRWQHSGDVNTEPQLFVRNGATVFLSGITLELNGRAEALRIDNASVVLERCSLSQNTGGGIVAANSDVQLDRCSVTRNEAGGIVTSGGTLDLINTIVSGAQDADAVSLSNGSTASFLYSTLAGQSEVFSRSRALACGDSTVVVRNSLFVAANAQPEFECPDANVSFSAAEMELPGESNVALGNLQPTWFVGFGQGDLRLDQPPPELAQAAQWRSGDPSTDIEGDPRPTEDGTPDYAGADLPSPEAD